MKLIEFISPKAIILELKSNDKKGVIEELVKIIKSSYAPKRFPINKIVSACLIREKLGSTGLGNGVAIPHAKITYTNKIVGAYGYSPRGVDFNALDGGLVHFIFLLLSPTNDNENKHLQALKSIVYNIQQPNFTKFLKNIKTIEEAKELFGEFEFKG